MTSLTRYLASTMILEKRLFKSILKSKVSFFSWPATVYEDHLESSNRQTLVANVIKMLQNGTNLVSKSS